MVIPSLLPTAGRQGAQRDSARGRAAAAAQWLIGVDWAWSDRHESGVAILRWDGAALTFQAAEAITTLEEIAARIRALDGSWCIAIDAPLIVRNQSGRRPVDGLISARYHRFHAGAYPANLRLLGGKVRGGDLVRQLQGDGLRMAGGPERAAQVADRWAFETYPHAEMVEVFGLPRIFKYKRGRVAAKRKGLLALMQCFRERFPDLEPPLALSAPLRDLLSTDPDLLRGRALKRHEDLLDAVFCAYLAAYAWYWGSARSRVLGDQSSGEVILPARRPDLAL